MFFTYLTSSVRPLTLLCSYFLLFFISFSFLSLSVFSSFCPPNISLFSFPSSNHVKCCLQLSNSMFSSISSLFFLNILIYFHASSSVLDLILPSSSFSYFFSLTPCSVLFLHPNIFLCFFSFSILHYTNLFSTKLRRFVSIKKIREFRILLKCDSCVIAQKNEIFRNTISTKNTQMKC